MTLASPPRPRCKVSTPATVLVIFGLGIALLIWIVVKLG